MTDAVRAPDELLEGLPDVHVETNESLLEVLDLRGATAGSPTGFSAAAIVSTMRAS